MAVTPLPGVPPEQVLEALRDVETDLTNARGLARDSFDSFNRYLLWASSAARRLGTLVRPVDVDRLVLTPRHWVLQTVEPANLAGEPLLSVVNLEFEERLREFASALADQRQVVERWRTGDSRIVVPDTNVFVQHRLSFDQIEWRVLAEARELVDVRVVVPLLVIDELDKHKRSRDKRLRSRARQALKIINGLLTNPKHRVDLQTPADAIGRVTLELFLDDPGHARLPGADDELVDRAAALRGVSGRAVMIVSFDTGMAFRARAVDLEVRHLDESDEAETS